MLFRDKPLKEKMTAAVSFQRIREAVPALSVGMLTADLLRLGSEIQLLESNGIRLVHFDVMDGCFCPMMTIGPPLIKAVKTPLLKDVHLMIENPLDKLAAYVAAGADMITVHVESTQHIHRVMQSLGSMENANDPERGLLRGVAINPGTPVEAVGEVLDVVEMVLVLAVNPGWGGQRFLQSTTEKLNKAKEMIRASGRDILLGVDGGVTQDNISEIARSGPDLIVTGSAVFDGKAAAENIRNMIAAINDRGSGTPGN